MLLIIWVGLITSCLIILLIVEYLDAKKNKEKIKRLSNNTPVILFTEDNVLHWRTSMSKDLGELREAKKDGVYLNGKSVSEGPHYRKILVLNPKELEGWAKKFKTVRDIKEWYRIQANILKEAENL